MTLTFPNPSRSFDPAKNAVRFLGYDGMFEVPFFVEAAALARPGSQALTEAYCLAAFDAARNSVYRVAQKAYAQGRRTAYVLTVADFQ